MPGMPPGPRWGSKRSEAERGSTRAASMQASNHQSEAHGTPKPRAAAASGCSRWPTTANARGPAASSPGGTTSPPRRRTSWASSSSSARRSGSPPASRSMQTRSAAGAPKGAGAPSPGGGAPSACGDPPIAHAGLYEPLLPSDCVFKMNHRPAMGAGWGWARVRARAPPPPAEATAATAATDAHAKYNTNPAVAPVGVPRGALKITSKNSAPPYVLELWLCKSLPPNLGSGRGRRRVQGSVTSRRQRQRVDWGQGQVFPVG